MKVTYLVSSQRWLVLNNCLRPITLLYCNVSQTIKEKYTTTTQPRLKQNATMLITCFPAFHFFDNERLDESSNFRMVKNAETSMPIIIPVTAASIILSPFLSSQKNLSNNLHEQKERFVKKICNNMLGNLKQRGQK